VPDKPASIDVEQFSVQALNQSLSRAILANSGNNCCSFHHISESPPAKSLTDDAEEWSNDHDAEEWSKDHAMNA